MRTFSFRLASVLRVRRVEAAIARGHVAEAARAVSAAVARELEITESYRRATRSVDDTDGASFVASFEDRARFALMVTQATDSRSELEAKLHEAQCTAALAERRVAMIDRLHDRRRSEWLDDLQRTEAAELDEFCAARDPSGDGGTSCRLTPSR